MDVFCGSTTRKLCIPREEEKKDEKNIFLEKNEEVEE
jgi:hypothetical protein